MRKMRIALLLCVITYSVSAQQWAGDNNLTSTIYRNGSIGANGLYLGRYGSSLAGDSNPYTISSYDNEMHDLILYGSSEATLHFRLYDGDLKFGPNTTPNAILYNSGAAFFNGNVGIGTNTPSYKLDVLGNLRTSSFIDAREYITVGNGSSYKVAMNAQSDGYVTGRDAAFNDKFLISTNGISYLNGGNVGIGTNAPQALLNVNLGSGNSITGTPALRIGGTANYPSLEFGIKGNYDGMISTYGNDLHIYAGNWRSEGATASENHNISFYTSQSGSTNWNSPKMYLRYDGNLGLGTTNPTQKLTVKGTVYSTEVKVDVNAGTGPDYVFEPSYQLPSLTEIENYIKANKHLPEVPSAKEMEANGINLSEMNMLLLKKVEELTLYAIEQSKIIENLQQEKQSNNMKFDQILLQVLKLNQEVEKLKSTK
jgi:Phage T4 tail fibre